MQLFLELNIDRKHVINHYPNFMDSNDIYFEFKLKASLIKSFNKMLYEFLFLQKNYEKEILTSLENGTEETIKKKIQNRFDFSSVNVE